MKLTDTIGYDTNSEPPKKYIWQKEDGAYVYDFQNREGVRTIESIIPTIGGSELLSQSYTNKYSGGGDESFKYLSPSAYDLNNSLLDLNGVKKTGLSHEDNSITNIEPLYSAIDVQAFLDFVNDFNHHADSKGVTFYYYTDPSNRHTLPRSSEEYNLPEDSNRTEIPLHDNTNMHIVIEQSSYINLYQVRLEHVESEQIVA